MVFEYNIRQRLVIYSYQELMTESSRMPLFDLRKLNASLPVASVPNLSTRVLVMGAADDFIVVSVTFHAFCHSDSFHIRGTLCASTHMYIY